MKKQIFIFTRFKKKNNVFSAGTRPEWLRFDGQWAAWWKEFIRKGESAPCIKIASLPSAFAHQSSGRFYLPLSRRLQNTSRPWRRSVAAITSIPAKPISFWRTIMLEIWMLLQRTSGEKKTQQKNDFITGSRTGTIFDLLLLLPSIMVLNNGCSLEARAMSHCKPTLLQNKMSQMHHRRPAGPSDDSYSVAPPVSSVPNWKEFLSRWVKDGAIKCLQDSPSAPNQYNSTGNMCMSSVFISRISL